MSAFADLDTIPWVPRIPRGALSAYEQALELHRVRRHGRIKTTEAAALLGIDSFTAQCLKYVWNASPALRELLRAGSVSPYPAAVLAKLEVYVGAEALVLARGYVKEALYLRALEDRLFEAQRAAVREREARGRASWRR